MNAPGSLLAPPRNGLGIAAFVLGLFALLFSWTVLGGIVLGVPAVTLGLLGRGRARRGEATNGRLSVAGTVLGAIGLLVAIVLIVFWVSALNTPAGRMYRQCLEQSAGNPNRIEQCADQFIQQYR